jgi:hypothetical protein
MDRYDLLIDRQTSAYAEGNVFRERLQNTDPDARNVVREEWAVSVEKYLGHLWNNFGRPFEIEDILVMDDIDSGRLVVDPTSASELRKLPDPVILLLAVKHAIARGKLPVSSPVNANGYMTKISEVVKHEVMGATVKRPWEQVLIMFPEWAAEHPKRAK